MRSEGFVSGQLQSRDSVVDSANALLGEPLDRPGFLRRLGPKAMPRYEPVFPAQHTDSAWSQRASFSVSMNAPIIAFVGAAFTLEEPEDKS